MKSLVPGTLVRLRGDSPMAQGVGVVLRRVEFPEEEFPFFDLEAQDWYDYKLAQKVFEKKNMMLVLWSGDGFSSVIGNPIWLSREDVVPLPPSAKITQALKSVATEPQDK